jgi:4a-hydroxytetrahydrobiopterin dehydratase
MSELASKNCEACNGDVPPLTGSVLAAFAKKVDRWTVVGEHHIEKTFEFDDFVSALAYVNKVGVMAEEQGHHPDIFLAWGQVKISVFTHAIDGLTESDFILAAKCDALYPCSTWLR